MWNGRDHLIEIVNDTGSYVLQVVGRFWVATLEGSLFGGPSTYPLISLHRHVTTTSKCISGGMGTLEKGDP
jgi:hypothetical protein